MRALAPIPRGCAPQGRAPGMGSPSPVHSGLHTCGPVTQPPPAAPAGSALALQEHHLLDGVSPAHTWRVLHRGALEPTLTPGASLIPPPPPAPEPPQLIRHWVSLRHGGPVWGEQSPPMPVTVVHKQHYSVLRRVPVD